MAKISLTRTHTYALSHTHTNTHTRTQSGEAEGDDAEGKAGGAAISGPDAAQSTSSNCKSSLSILGGVVNYFNSEWSFAKFRS